MANKKQKLELTWIGKDDEPKLEPRILIEDPEKSYGDKNTQNMLIHGDNLLALKALEQDFAGKIKCIYIDPPYNTGNAFEHYDDGLEHSIWLNLMKPRIEILQKLLSSDGSLWISIDDEECHYLKILCDEIFGRKNFVTTLCVKMSTPSGVKTSHKEKTILKEKEFVLVYARNRECFSIIPQYIPKLDWDEEFQYFLEKNGSDDPENWEIERLRDVLAKNNIDFDPELNEFKKFVIDNADKIWRRAFIRGPYKERSQREPNKIFFVKNNTGSEHYYYRGRELFFYRNRFNDCFTEEGTINVPSHLLCDLWGDINTGKLFNEGDVDFRNGKKPEFLIGRIINMCTEKGDIVLDSFIGSGTTAAVAHKMGRQWIGVELGDHCYTHCHPRLKQVCDGTDQGGISKSVDWKGGGGFKFYELAPSLLRKDKYDNWVIDKRYNADMLASAMAKHEGFKYNPDKDIYWKQGQSTEKDFIFTTTRMVTAAFLDKLHEDMSARLPSQFGQEGSASGGKGDESLLICCKSYQKVCENRYPNITIRKIPHMLLGRCEFGKEDYSLNIINMPYDEDESDFIPAGPQEEKPSKGKKKGKTAQMNLFPEGA